MSKHFQYLKNHPLSASAANTYGDDEARTHLCTPNTLWDNLDTEDQELIASNLAEFCSNHKQGIPIPNDITHEDTDSK